MAETTEKHPDDATRRFLRSLFSEYYAKQAKFFIPALEKREFGIGNIKKIDARHLNFSNEQEFRNYLVTNTPFFVSHSAAYYERPGATPQDRKGWLGADLIFDLDLHAEGKYGVYSVLDKVKQDVIRLRDEFLVGDFGIAKNETAIVFSGNRGYHIHIRDKAYWDLGPEERRELGDYINGIGLDYTKFFTEEEIPGRKFSKIMGPKPTDYGYRGRFARAVVKLIERSQPYFRTLRKNRNS
jgi:DNA primase small subunit